MEFSFTQIEDLVLADLYVKHQSSDENRDIIISGGVLQTFPSVRELEVEHNKGNLSIISTHEKAIKELIRLGYIEESSHSIEINPSKRHAQYTRREYEISAKGMKYVEDQVSKNNEIIFQRLKSAQNGVDPFDGIGSVDVEFFGRNLKIGCVKGEEDETREIVKNIEIDAGETLKAATAPLDDFRALLMGSVLAVKEYKNAQNIPASNRTVTLTDNQIEGSTKALEDFIQEFRQDHHFGNEWAAEKSVLIEALKAGKTYIEHKVIEVRIATMMTIEPLKEIAAKYSQAAVGGTIGAMAQELIKFLIDLFKNG